MPELFEAIDTKTAVVSLQWVNNETGIVQPIDEVAKRCREVGALFHTDACQAVGKLLIGFNDAGFDFFTMTGHKIHGPKGIGALICRKLPAKSPFLAGGTQEFGVRPGTENIPGILGFGQAAKLRRQRFEQVADYVTTLRDRFEQTIMSSTPDITVNARGSTRVGNTTNLLFPGVEGAALVNNLDLQGVECSQSSACTHARPEPSHVLIAMGLSEEDAYASIRFGLSELNTEEEMDIAAGVIIKSYRQLRSKTLAMVR